MYRETNIVTYRLTCFALSLIEVYVWYNNRSDILWDVLVQDLMYFLIESNIAFVKNKSEDQIKIYSITKTCPKSSYQMMEPKGRKLSCLESKCMLEFGGHSLVFHNMNMGSHT